MGKYVLIHQHYSVLLVDGADGLAAFLEDVRTEQLPKGKLWSGVRMQQKTTGKPDVKIPQQAK